MFGVSPSGPIGKRIFVLSPARANGKRATFLVGPGARCDLAIRLRTQSGIALGEVFSFLSGLYFRGKLTYARAFGRPPDGSPGAYVITPHRGLMSVEALITLEELRAFSRVDIDLADDRYRLPLQRDARRLATEIPAECEVVLLGSISTPKYTDVLLEVFGGRLRFPAEFVGRGDMSRGGLMLRCVSEARELEYLPVLGSVRRGKRPVKLQPRAADPTLAAPFDRHGNRPG